MRAQTTSQFRGTQLLSRPSVRQCRTGRSVVPQANLFANLFGGGKKKESAPAEYVDDADLPFPKTLLNPTYLKGRKLALAYMASRDGWSPKAFHEKVILLPGMTHLPVRLLLNPIQLIFPCLPVPYSRSSSYNHRLISRDPQSFSQSRRTTRSLAASIHADLRARTTTAALSTPSCSSSPRREAIP